MPAQSEFGDAATVIDGPAGSSGYASYKHAHAHVASGRAKGAESASASARDTALSTFARTPDYFSEERPFVVLIGKKGVLGALEELDAHLRTVRVWTNIRIGYWRKLTSVVVGWKQQDSFG